ncbi:hypothetical protein Cgig2_017247 [Carnegiea gigantea]|uniref:Uncharacterized protein n=1 Tax=Carnegiea gigantea TaxID=171969 RepID=A0A9Q1JN62_9CARY|nr:hypothetical protein Cgig2_017247 [Carnegiea gigantea]
MGNSTYNMRKAQLFGTVLEDKENIGTLKLLNANVNKVMKHVVDNETTKSNKHMINTCATTYIAHSSKSSEKKESPMKFENADGIKRKRRIVAEHNFSKDDITATNELTRLISVGGLNFLRKEDKKVNMNKLRSILQYLIQSANPNHLFATASNFPVHVEQVARQGNGFIQYTLFVYVEK